MPDTPAPRPLPETIAIARVGLAVADLARSLRFYGEVMGLDIVDRQGGTARLGAGGRPLLELEERPEAVRDQDEAGLFHVAWRVPDRPALGAFLRHLRAAGWPLAGASDHDVSEALYLADPDGHGIEVYRDRPRSTWLEGGRLRMGTDRLDVAGVLDAASDLAPRGLPAGTDLGHVHLETHDLAAARRFYEGGLGMAVMIERPGALFLSKGGYHHHLAVNAWGRRTRPQAPGALGLLFYAIAADAAPVTLRDPQGVELRVVPPARA